MITYIVGYWKIPENPKRDFQYYMNVIANTFEKLKGHPVVFFYQDDEVFQKIEALKVEGHNIIFIKTAIEDLPTYALSANLLQSCKLQNMNYLKIKEKEKVKEKGYVHFNRDLTLSDDDTYRKMITIWTSKFYLIEQIININPFKTDDFAWVDASASRFRVRDDLYKTFKNGLINALNTSMTYNGERLFNGATIMISDRETWEWFIPLYKDILDKEKDSNYAHDEETLFKEIISNIYVFNL